MIWKKKAIAGANKRLLCYPKGIVDNEQGSNDAIAAFDGRKNRSITTGIAYGLTVGQGVGLTAANGRILRKAVGRINGKLSGNDAIATKN